MVFAEKYDEIFLRGPPAPDVARDACSPVVNGAPESDRVSGALRNGRSEGAVGAVGVSALAGCFFFLRIHC